MKLSCVSLLGLVASMAHFTHGEDFDHLLDLIVQLEEEAAILVESSEAKDDEIFRLTEALEECEADGGGGNEGWIPSIGESWNYNLATPVRTDIDVDVFLIDMDDAQDTIDTLHDQGKVVVCYISIGSVEDWRDDVDEFPEEAIGNALENWEGEKWLDVNNEVVRQIMASRVEKAASMSCDGIEPDNMSVYTENNTGVSVTEEQQKDYNIWFAETVHDSGMKVALKNIVELVPVLVDYFDFAVNESCNEYDECDVYTDTFLAQGKPVFNVEYSNNMDMCDYTNELGFDTIIKNYNLKGHFCSCVDSDRDWKCNRVI